MLGVNCFVGKTFPVALRSFPIRPFWGSPKVHCHYRFEFCHGGSHLRTFCPLAGIARMVTACDRKLGSGMWVILCPSSSLVRKNKAKTKAAANANGYFTSCAIPIDRPVVGWFRFFVFCASSSTAHLVGVALA